MAIQPEAKKFSHVYERGIQERENIFSQEKSYSWILMRRKLRFICLVVNRAQFGIFQVQSHDRLSLMGMK